MKKFFLLLLWILIASPAYAGIGDIEAAVMNKDYVLVKELSSKVLKNSNDPKQRIEAEYYYGLAQLRLGKYAEARKAFQIVMQANTPQDVYDKAALGMVEGLHMGGFYKDALKEGERLLSKSPKSQYLSLIYLKLARTNLKLMRWAKANEYLNKIIDEFPQSPEAPVARQLLDEKEYFTVQVGSFVERSRALTLSNELKDSGHYAYIVESTSDNKTFYRVRVGQMTSLKDAQNLETKLSQLGYPTLIYP